MTSLNLPQVSQPKPKTKPYLAIVGAVALLVASLTVANNASASGRYGLGDVFAKGVTYCADTYPGHGTGHPGAAPSAYVVDLNTNDNTGSKGELFAPDDGTVTIVEWDTGKKEGYGNAIVWTSVDGKEKLHLAHLITFGKTGKVAAGDPIGQIGDTGFSDGAHLHISRLLNGNHAPLVLSGVEIEPFLYPGRGPYGVWPPNCNSGVVYTSKGPAAKPAAAFGAMRMEGEWILTNSIEPDVDRGNRDDFRYGGSSFFPVVGDWDGDGTDTVGAFRPSDGTWILSNSTQPDVDRRDRIVFRYGGSSFFPVVGDWDGDGDDTVGVFRPSDGTWILTNSRRPDWFRRDRIEFKYGTDSFIPVAGDWDGDGDDTVGVFRPSDGTWILTNSRRPDRFRRDRIEFKYGNSDFLPVVGNWDGYPGDNPGVFRPSDGTWILTNSIRPDLDPNNRVEFKYGTENFIPVAGNWDGIPGDNPGVARRK